MEKQEVILYVLFVKIYCDSFERICGAFIKQSKNMTTGV